MVRHHVIRQPSRQYGLYIVQVFFTVDDDKRHQLLAGRQVDCQDSGFLHGRVLQQARLDLAKLDTQATDLHLVVDPPSVLDHPVFTLARQVTCAVETLPVTEGADTETLGRQHRALMVTAGQADTAQIQFARDRRRHRVELIVKNVGMQVGNRPADRNAVTLLVHTVPMGDVDSRFGRPVQVVELGTRQQCHRAALQLKRQRLAGTHHLP